MKGTNGKRKRRHVDRLLGSCQEELTAWNNYKGLRNKINNIKKNEEYRYKKQIFSASEESPQKTWNCLKKFMEWKCAGTPNQIAVNNILYKKTS